MKDKPKRIIDILLTFSLFLLIATPLYAWPPLEGYTRNFFASITLTANATGSITITEPVDCITIYKEAGLEFDYQFATSTVYVASASFKALRATDTFELQPIHLSDNCFLWIKNGAAAQKITVFTYGR